MITKDLGLVTAYAYAVSGGYTGTEAEFTELLGNIAEDLEEIENLSVTVETLPPGSEATASYADGVLHLGIPRGDKGDKGDTGETGPQGPKGDPGDVSTEQLEEAISGVQTEMEENYARNDGYYEEMTVGDAEQLISTQFVEDSEPYLFRPTGGSADVGNREYLDKIVGGTVAWNQLVQNGNFADTSGWTSDDATLTANGNVLTYTSTTASGSAAVIGNVLNTTAGHKYFVSVDIKCNNTLPASGVWVGSGGHDGVTKAITELNKWVSVSGVFIRATGGNDKISVYPRTTSWNEGDTCDMRNIVCFDLTQMFNPTIADYIYSLEQSQAGAGVAWFRQYFPEDYYPYSANTLQSVQATAHNDGDGNVIGNYALDSSLTLRGAPKLVDGKLAFDGDVYLPSGEVQRRYGLRAYQSGDESLTDAITDGTNTVYKLTTPTTETADGYEQCQICDSSGTEEFVTTGIVPVGHETRYPANLRDKLQRLPDLPSPLIDGVYMVMVSGSQMHLEKFLIPDAPTEDETYTLKATVSDGTPTYTWEVEE